MPDTIPFAPSFSGKNVEAQRAAAVRAWDAHSQKVITDVSNETRDNIKNLVTRSIRDGIAPRDAARLIKPMIGLTSRQGQAAMNYRAGLVARGLSTDKVEKLTAKYAGKQLRFRAEMIARTETMGALNEGQKAAWREAQSEGLLSTRAEKVWLTADPCPICAPMEGERVLLGESFATGDPPIHPRCRCTFTIESMRQPVVVNKNVPFDQAAYDKMIASLDARNAKKSGSDSTKAVNALEKLAAGRDTIPLKDVGRLPYKFEQSSVETIRVKKLIETYEQWKDVPLEAYKVGKEIHIMNGHHRVVAAHFLRRSVAIAIEE